MFSITSQTQDGFELIELKDITGKTYVQIIPGCGAVLHSFNTWRGDHYLNIIDNYIDKEDFEKNVTAKGFKSCKLSPFACRIKDALYEFNGTRYRADKFLLGNNALHGLIYDAPFNIVSAHADDNSATLVLQYAYHAVEKGYPFNYDCTVTYQLKPGNELLIATTVVNKDENRIPVQDGWHPYFTLGKRIDELTLTLHSKEQVVFDSEIIPTGEMKPYRDFFDGRQLEGQFFDDCFLLDLSAGKAACILADRENNIQVEIRPDNSYPYLQLYTPPHRNSIAIENLSAPPDTFNNHVNLIVLDPGESANFATSFVVTSLK